MTGKDIPNIRISETSFILFIEQAKQLKEYCPKINCFNNIEVQILCKEIIASICTDEILLATNYLNNSDIGAVAIDIPTVTDLSISENDFYGVACQTGFVQNIYNTISDPVNKTPFNVFAASKEGKQKLYDNGIKIPTASDLLKYHTDGLINNGKAELPKYIGVYNVSIAYEQPGNFYWIPLSCWSEFAEYSKIINNKVFTIDLTPSIYNEENSIDTKAKSIETNIFKNIGNNNIVMFYNGQIRFESENDKQILNEMESSISRVKNYFYSPQKIRRLTIVNNWLGLHSRDVFEKPIENIKITRVYLRTCSQESVLMNK